MQGCYHSGTAEDGGWKLPWLEDQLTSQVNFEFISEFKTYSSSPIAILLYKDVEVDVYAW